MSTDPANRGTPSDTADRDARTTRTADRDARTTIAERDARTLTAAREQRSKERRLRTRDIVLAIATPIVLLLVWELAARTDAIDSRLFPPPTRIFAQAGEMLSDGTLLEHLGATTVRLLVGMGFGAVLGVLVGLAMGTSRALNAALGPMFSALYALPKIAILPLLLLIFGLTETPKILAVAISVFFVMQINTVAGVRQIDPKINEAALAYGARGLARFWQITLPGALPFIFSGLRVATGTAVIVITAVEFVASNTGLGFLIWNSWQLFQPEQMYVGLVTVALVGALLTGIFALLERLAVPWRRGRK